MPTFRLRYLPGNIREIREINCDRVDREGGWLVFRAYELVIGLPREVVVLRVREHELTPESSGQFS